MEDLKDLVEDILLKNPKTRDSDERLYNKLLRLKGFEINSEIFVNYRNYKLPSFSSVSRARRKVQEDERKNKGIEDWELQSTKTVEKYRRQLEKEYRNYYKN